MRRREFITLLGGAAAAWPLAARAQQPAMPVIGFLNAGSPDGFAPYIAAFRQGLKEAGYVEGQNTTIEYRWAEGRNDRLPELATDLVGRRVTVISTPGGLPEALAAKAVAGSIPVVFGTGADPVQAGLVASLARPGGNVTGVTAMNAEIGAKRLGLLLELVPAAKSIAVLVNPANPLTEPFIADVQTGASVTGRQLDLFRTRSSRDIDAAFGELVQKRADAIVVGPDTLFRDRRVQLATLTARHALPSIYAFVRTSMPVGS
jgi:ABC-type uncharacterized transport system substrate-binding protein